MTTDAIEAESAVCGSILLDSKCLPEITDFLTEDDFVLDANKAIFRAAVKLDRVEEPIDPITILREAGESVSREYIMELMTVTATAANAGVYAEETRKKSMRRALRSLGYTLEERSKTENDPRDTIGDAKRILEQIESQDNRRELITSSESFEAFYRHREAVDSGKGGFIPTGYKDLDALLGGGLLNTGFYILAARPGMGKTTFALAIADNVARQGQSVLFLSLEMSEEQIAAKRLSRASGIGYDTLMMGEMGDQEYNRIAEFSVKLSRFPIMINKKPRATVEDITAIARKVSGLSLLVIDYFGLIQTGAKRQSRTEAMTEVSGQLKALARKLKIPILCLAQLNRENMSRQDKRPMLSELRDTGALEQDADGVIFLHCPSYYTSEHPDPWSPDPMQVILAKNRHANTGTCNMAFYRAVGRIIPAINKPS